MRRNKLFECFCKFDVFVSKHSKKKKKCEILDFSHGFRCPTIRIEGLSRLSYLLDLVLLVETFFWATNL